MLEQVESAYETVFSEHRADSQFFAELDEADADYRKRTSKRPIGPRDVKTAQRLFRDRCRTVMAEARKRTK